MSNFQQKIIWHVKKQESMARSQEKKELIETVPEEAQTLDLLDKDLKSALLNILKKLKDNKLKEPRERRLTK